MSMPDPEPIEEDGQDRMTLKEEEIRRKLQRPPRMAPFHTVSDSSRRRFAENLAVLVNRANQ